MTAPSLSQDSEIPADVMAVAEGIAADLPSRVGKYGRIFAARVIARAILVERDRCARVAYGFRRYSGKPGAVAVNPYADAGEIAAAIRQGATT